MKLEVGKYYRTRDGRKAKVIKEDGSKKWPCLVHYVDDERLELWCSREGVTNIWNREDDLIAEWTDTPEVGPVRTVTTTRQEIVPGVYGCVKVHDPGSKYVRINVDASMGVDDLTATIATLTTIRDAMQANATA